MHCKCRPAQARRTHRCARAQSLSGIYRTTSDAHIQTTAFDHSRNHKAEDQTQQEAADKTSFFWLIPGSRLQVESLFCFFNREEQLIGTLFIDLDVPDTSGGLGNRAVSLIDVEQIAFVHALRVVIDHGNFEG